MSGEAPKFTDVFAEMTGPSGLSPKTVRRVFDAIFAGWHRQRYAIRDAPCLELYRTPARERVETVPVTELWIPIEEPT